MMILAFMIVAIICFLANIFMYFGELISGTIELYSIKESFDSLTDSLLGQKTVVVEFQIPRVNEEIAQIIDAHFNDSQNVHDRSVRTDIDRKFLKLRESFMADVKEDYQRAQNDCIAEFLQHVSNYPEQSRGKLMRAAALIMDPTNTKTFEDGLEVTELEFFAVVWHRFKKLNLDKEVFISQILDVMAPDGPVCFTGRISRYISSLSALDTDPEIAQPEITNAVLFREALNRMQQLYTKYFEKNPQYAEIRDKQQTTAEEELRFEVFMRKVHEKITEKILKEYPLLNQLSVRRAVEAL